MVDPETPLPLRLRLVADWQWVLRRAWSVRFAIAACVFSGLEGACGVVTAMMSEPPLGIPPGLFASFAGLCSMFALAARFIAQKKDDE